MRISIALAAVAALTAGSAHAQEVYVDDPYIDADDGPYVDHRAVVGDEIVEDAAPAAPATGPRVYGWSYGEIRPTDCGTFKYWNGEYCADARYEPPPTD